MNAIEKAIRRLGLLTLPPAEATTVTWDFNNEQDVVIPKKCSGDPSHGEIVFERRIPGKRSKSITIEEGSTPGAWRWLVTLVALFFGWLVILGNRGKKTETVKLAFNHNAPYCAACYQGMRRTLIIRNILTGVTIVCGLAICVLFVLEWGQILFSVGAVSVVGIVFCNLVRNKSNTIRILDFEPFGQARKVTLRFANPDYAELFVLENSIVALKDPRPKARLAAANLLGPMGDFRATLPLVNALNDLHDDVREAATKSLLQLNDPKTKEALLDGLTNPNVSTRLAAASVLKRQIDDEETAAAFIAALGSDDAPEMRLAAAEILPAAGETAIDPLIAALQDDAVPVRVQAAQGLRTLAAVPAVPALIAALDDSVPEVRREAAQTLGALNDQSAIDPLLQILDDQSVDVARTAVTSLLTLAPDQPLIRALHDLVNGKNEAQTEAAHTLAELGNPRAIPALRRALHGSDEARREAALALVCFGPDAALKPLLAALADSDSGLRALAANALGQLADPQAKTPLLQALQDSSAEVRQNAVTALVSASEPSFHPVAETMRTLVTGLLEERLAAVQRLAANGGDHVKDLLVWTLLHDEDVHVRTAVARTLSQLGVDSTGLLIDSLNTPQSNRASEALIALGPDAVDALATAAREQKGAIQKAAIKSLGQIEDGRAESILIEVLQNPNAEPGVQSEAFDALGGIKDNPHLVPVVIKMIEDDDFSVQLQKTAVLQLGHSNDPVAAAALVDALDNWSLRYTARDALRQLGDTAADPLLARYEIEKNKELRQMIGELLGDKKPAGFVGRMFGRK